MDFTTNFILTRYHTLENFSIMVGAPGLRLELTK